jgi:hypothetical protein
MVKTMKVSAILGVVLTILPASASAQDAFGIVDNSFLVEEAFNQERGIFQNIVNYRWHRGEWLGSFTQEWPIPTMRHQLSFTLPFGSVADRASIGDALVNYRLQVLEEGEGRPAFAPRISLIVPLASRESELGGGVVGLQFNLPFSKRRGDWYFHWNGGLTFLPGDEDRFGDDAEALTSPFVAGSVIWQASSTLNFLVEAVGESIALPDRNGKSERLRQLTLSPGMRYAWNPGKAQVVVGLAAPITRAYERNTGSVLGYFSYELPFK